MKIVIRIFTVILLVMGNIRGNMNAHSGKCDFIDDVTSFQEIPRERGGCVCKHTLAKSK